MGVLDDVANGLRRAARSGGQALSNLGGADAVAAAPPVPPAGPTTAPPVAAPPVAPPATATPSAGGAVPPQAPPAAVDPGTAVPPPATAAAAADQPGVFSRAATGLRNAVTQNAPDGTTFMGRTPGAGFIANTGKVLGQAIGGAGVGLGGAAEAAKGYDDSKILNNAAPDATTAALDTAGLAGERVGRFAGATAGAAAGAGLGSVVPGVGTAIGGLAGGALGYFAPDLVNAGVNAVFGNDNQLPSQKAQSLRDAAPQPVTATPVPNASTTGADINLPGSTFPTSAPLGLNNTAAPAAPAGPIGTPTSVPGIVRNGSSFTNVGPDGTPTTASQTSLPNTGFDLGAANAAQARANQISLRSPAGGDSNNLFSNTNGTASVIGNTPYGGDIVPRQTVSPGGGIGGLIVQKHLNRQRALDLEQQQITGDQAIRTQDLGLRRDQLGFDRQYKSADLNHRIDHDNATLGISQQQLLREGARDQNTANYQQGRLSLEDKRANAEIGLRRDNLQREQDATNFTQRQEAENNYGKQVAGTISNTLRDDKGNVDPNITAEHVSNANGLVANRISQLQNELKVNPGNTQARAVLNNYTAKGIAALTPADTEHVQAATEFGQLARKYGSNDFNPVGGTNVESRTPVASIRRESSLTGAVYRGYDANGKPLQITAPARAIEGDGSFVGGTRNQRFKSLIGGQ